MLSANVDAKQKTPAPHQARDVVTEDAVLEMRHAMAELNLTAIGSLGCVGSPMIDVLAAGQSAAQKQEIAPVGWWLPLPVASEGELVPVSADPLAPAHYININS